jgi:hypothetical protein
MTLMILCRDKRKKNYKRERRMKCGNLKIMCGDAEKDVGDKDFMIEINMLMVILMMMKAMMMKINDE